MNLLRFLFARSTAAAVVLGLDVGFHLTKVALITDTDQAVVVSNYQGARQTPSVMNFAKIPTRIGDTARVTQMNSPQEVVSNFQWFGLRDCNKDIHSQRFIPYIFECSHHEEERGRASLGLRGGDLLLSVEQYWAQWMQYAKGLAVKHLEEISTERQDLDQLELSVVVPVDIELHEVVKLRSAAELVGIKLSEVVPAPLAAAAEASLGIYDSMAESDIKDGDNIELLVLDMGHGIVQFCHVAYSRDRCRFCPPTTSTRGCGAVRGIGGQALDESLADIAIERFEAKTNIFESLDEDEKARKRSKAATAVNKVKETLSTSQSRNFTIDHFVEQEKLSETLTQDDVVFAIEAMQFHDKLSLALENLRESGDIDWDKLSSVELIGGHHRVPAVRNCLERIFQGKPIRNTMNPDLGAALGATQLLATARGGFRRASNLVLVDDSERRGVVVEGLTGELSLGLSGDDLQIESELFMKILDDNSRFQDADAHMNDFEAFLYEIRSFLSTEEAKNVETPKLISDVNLHVEKLIDWYQNNILNYSPIEAEKLKNELIEMMGKLYLTQQEMKERLFLETIQRQKERQERIDHLTEFRNTIGAGLKWLNAKKGKISSIDDTISMVIEVFEKEIIWAKKKRLYTIEEGETRLEESKGMLKKLRKIVKSHEEASSKERRKKKMEQLKEQRLLEEERLQQEAKEFSAQAEGGECVEEDLFYSWFC